MNQYIITEEQLSYLEQSPFDLDTLENKKVSDVVRSHPYNPQAEREKVLDELAIWLDTEHFWDGEIPETVLMKKIEELRKDGE